MALGRAGLGSAGGVSPPVRRVGDCGSQQTRRLMGQGVCLVQACHFTEVGVGGPAPDLAPGGLPEQSPKLELGQPKEGHREGHSRPREQHMWGDLGHSRGLESRCEGCMAREGTVAPRGLSPERGPEREGTAQD